MNIRYMLLFVLAPILVLGVIGCGGPLDAPTPYPTPTSRSTDTQIIEREVGMNIDQNSKYVATIITNHGSVEIELFAKEAPKTVNNFATLSRDGFYDGVIFHRVIPGFMIQGGDPTGTGRGGPGYTFEDEFDATLRFDKPGLLAMANSGPNTNGSQFFITTAPTPHLTGAHTIFGRVLAGQDVVEAISVVSTSAGDKPIDDVKIQGIEIEETAGE